MKKRLRVLAIALGVAVGAVAAVAVVRIGPSNLIGMMLYDQRREGDLKVGDPAPDVALLELDGSTRVHLRDRIGDKPLILVFGSYT